MQTTRSDVSPAALDAGSAAGARPEPVASRRAQDLDGHTRGVRRMFDDLAPTYDVLNRVMTAGIDRRWRARALDALDAARPVGPVLDLCAGTLDLSAQLARRRGPGEVTALDLSAAMLERGASKAPGVRRVVGDACALPFEDGAFDGVICAFGLRNVGDLDRALAECARVLRPGGVLVTLELFRPTRRSGRAFLSAFHAVAPRVAAVVADADAYRYLARSMDGFVDVATFGARLRAAGFEAPRADDRFASLAQVVTARRPGAS